MSLPYPPILESQALSRQAGVVNNGEDRFFVNFQFPRNTDVNQIGHVGILIRQQLTMIPWAIQAIGQTISPFSPDQEVIYLNVGDTSLSGVEVSTEDLLSGRIRIPMEALRRLQAPGQPGGFAAGFNASANFTTLDTPLTPDVPGQTYTIQIRFGNNPAPRGSGAIPGFASWHSEQVMRRQFGEWSNTQRMFVFAGEIENIFPNPQPLEENFLAGFTWQYAPVSEDPLASARLTYTYFTPEGPGRFVFSENLPFQSAVATNTQTSNIKQWGADGTVELPIARITRVQCILELLTVNNTSHTHSFFINEFWSNETIPGRTSWQPVTGDIRAGFTEIPTLRGEEIDDGAIAIKFSVKRLNQVEGRWDEIIIPEWIPTTVYAVGMEAQREGRKFISILNSGTGNDRNLNRNPLAPANSRFWRQISGISFGTGVSPIEIFRVNTYTMEGLSLGSIPVGATSPFIIKDFSIEMGQEYAYLGLRRFDEPFIGVVPDWNENTVYPVYSRVQRQVAETGKVYIYRSILGGPNNVNQGMDPLVASRFWWLEGEIYLEHAPTSSWFMRGDIIFSDVRPLFETVFDVVQWRPRDYEGIARNMNFNANSFLSTNLQQLRLTGNVTVRNFNRTVSSQITQTIGGKYPFVSRPADFDYRTMSISALISIALDPTHTFLSLVTPPERGENWWQGSLMERSHSVPWVSEDNKAVTLEQTDLIIGADSGLTGSFIVDGAGVRRVAPGSNHPRITAAAARAGLKDYFENVILREEDVFNNTSHSYNAQREFANQRMFENIIVGEVPKISLLRPGGLSEEVEFEWWNPERIWRPGDIDESGSLNRHDIMWLNNLVIQHAQDVRERILPGTYRGHPLDINGDGIVDSDDVRDLSLIANGERSPDTVPVPPWVSDPRPSRMVPGDFNGDGVVNHQDVVDLAAFWGIVPPEPNFAGNTFNQVRTAAPLNYPVPATYNGHPFAIEDARFATPADVFALHRFVRGGPAPAGLVSHINRIFFSNNTANAGGPLTIFDRHEGQNTAKVWETDPSVNIFAERKFRERVMKWLTDGKPKLFRSETEGNMIVMLTGVTFSPLRNDRLVYTFSATLTEIAEYNLRNLKLYDLIPADFSGRFEETPEFLANPTTVNQRQFKFIPSILDRNGRVAIAAQV